MTGAAGHLGGNLVRAFLAQGRPVRVLVHDDRRALAGLDIEAVPGDVRDLDSLVMAFKGAEVVYHLAARISISGSDWRALREINVGGTRNVVEACLRAGVRRLVHFSSIHTLKDTAGGAPVDESCALVEPGQPTYDCSKAEAEREVYRGIARGLDAVVIVPTAVVGPFDFKPSHFGEALLRLANGRLPALVTGGYNWVDARDVAAGAIRAAAQASPGAKYLLSGHWVSLHDLAALTAEMTGVPPPGFVCPEWLAGLGAPVVCALDRRAGRRPLYTRVSLETLHSHRNISHGKATEELGYRPRPYRETLRDTLAWFAEAGRLFRPLRTT